MDPTYERSVKSQVGPARCLQLYQGDITEQVADAIVNAANSRLAGGGGVDGAIHRRGGPSIMEETRRKYPDGCPTGSAVVTSAGQLQARYVFHAVGPYWNGGQRGEAELLQAAYTSCLKLASEYQCRSIAFPSLSTGAYRYPLDQAAEIALRCCWDWLTRGAGPPEIRFVLFDTPALDVFQGQLQSL